MYGKNASRNQTRFLTASAGVALATVGMWAGIAESQSVTPSARETNGFGPLSTVGLLVECGNAAMAAWKATLSTEPDEATQAAKLKETQLTCAQKLQREGKLNIIDPPPVQSSKASPCESSDAVSIAPQQPEVQAPVVEDVDTFPQACMATDAFSGAKVFWLRAHLRGGRFGDTPDPMFNQLRPGDGHLMILRSMWTKIAPVRPLPIEYQWWRIQAPQPQGTPPDSIYALLYRANGHTKILPLNYEDGVPPKIDMPWAPMELSATYDAGIDKYLLYREGATFLTPSWNSALPSWEQFYVWWFDPKEGTVSRAQLPPGPWVSDARLDIALGRAARNFSCGTDCYRHYNIRAESGVIFVDISGRSSAISTAAIGTYRLSQANLNWEKTQDGHPDP